MKTVSSKRLLILDNHRSYTITEFTSFYMDYNIVLLWMPPYSSYMLQPLNVACFGPLKQAFSKQNQNLIRNYIFYINKSTFIDAFKAAYFQLITPQNI
jgi:hypothetical protein